MLLRHSQLSRLPAVTKTLHRPIDILYTLDQVETSQELQAEDLLTQSLLVQQYESQSTEEFVNMLSEHEYDHQLWYLSLIKQWLEHGGAVNHASHWSVLDSGSSKHLNASTHITDAEDRKSLTGFNGSTEWTQGNGYLPLTVTDDITGENAKLDMENVDTMEGLSSNILSLGKLLKDGYEFHFTDKGKECHAITPGGAHKLRVNVGLDDIVRIENKVRTGIDAIPLPKLTHGVNALRRTADAANHSFLHDVFNHCGAEKLFQTLGVTKGYKQTRLSDQHCDTCAVTKSRGFGLRQKPLGLDAMESDSDTQLTALIETINQQESEDDMVEIPIEVLHQLCISLTSPSDNSVLQIGDVSDPIFDDANDNGPEDDTDNWDEFEYTAETAGRQLGVQPIPRFQLYTLKVFEVMFVDNKDVPCGIRGGAVTSLIFIDYKSRIKFKQDVHTKRDNGKAFQLMVAKNGIHKLDYPCRVFSDGCGSMVHVRDTATRLGIDHAYTPPHMQSLNEVEKVADQMWASARALMEHSQAPDNLFSKAVNYAMYVDIRTATTANRDWITPYEMVKGPQPTISKLHRFYTRAFVAVLKAK